MTSSMVLAISTNERLSWLHQKRRNHFIFYLGLFLFFIAKRRLILQSSLDFIFFWRVNDRCWTSVVISTSVVHTMPRQLLCLNHSKWTYGPTSLQALVLNILYSPDYPIYYKDGMFTSFRLGLFDLGYQWYERCTPFSIIFFFNRSFLL